MPARTDHTGRVVYVKDGLDGIATSLKYVIYQTESRGGSDPHPACWIDAIANLRSVTTKEADLVRTIAEQLKRRQKLDASLSVEDVACVKQTVKHLKAIERGLLTAAKNAQNAKAFLDAIDSGDD